MRRINHIVIHAAYTPKSMDIGAKEIRRWHVEDNGWSDIGYHFVIRRSGSVENGRPLEQAGAHVAGHNRHTIGICLVGGKNGKTGAADFNYSRKQLQSLSALVHVLKERFPDAEIRGHRDFDSGKECPCFDAAAWWADGG